jgi:hypothetical protein
MPLESTFKTFEAVGNKEDFHDMIYDISPTETPFFTMAKKLKARNKLHQWQKDSLAAASPTNTVIEGDDAAADTAIPTINLRNYTQLMDKVAFVSTTQEATDSYGRDSEMAYQMAKRSRELKRDLEAALVQNNSATVGSAGGNAHRMASFETWLHTQGAPATIGVANGFTVQEGTAGTTVGWSTSAGLPQTAPVDSTSTGSISEAVLKGCIERTWNAGGDPTVIMVPAAIKGKISGSFSGIATRFRSVGKEQADIVGGADLYISDFGEHKIVANRFMRTRTLFGIDPGYIGVAYLQSFNTFDLARTGHAWKRAIACEATLVVQNPDAHFKIADINPLK